MLLSTRLSARLSACAAALLISVSSVAGLLAPLTAMATDAPAAMEASGTVATPPGAAAPAPGIVAAQAAEKIDNPYGLDALWKGGDLVARGTLVILVLMSMSSWYIIITKVIDQTKLGGQAADANAALDVLQFRYRRDWHFAKCRRWKDHADGRREAA